VKRGWLVASAAFFLLFCFAALQSLALPLNDELGPGPGFFPLWLAGIGALLSLRLAFETARDPPDDAATSLVPGRAALLRIVCVLVMLVLAAASLNQFGWRITALVTTAFLLPALGARSPVAIVAFVLAASFGVFHVFYHWLKVPLPIGSFGI
jgi:putative tricarboxylic transport membrane protein